LIFDARVSRSTDLSLLDLAGNSAINQEIFKKEGILQVEFDAAFPINSQALEGLRFGLLNKVSLGGFRFRSIDCPLCNMSFIRPECQHTIPWVSMDGNSESITAPYYIRSGVYDLTECSLILCPNLPGAGILRRN
jgi:hypothetical protein